MFKIGTCPIRQSTVFLKNALSVLYNLAETALISLYMSTGQANTNYIWINIKFKLIVKI
jgi:hypothetical protein